MNPTSPTRSAVRWAARPALAVVALGLAVAGCSSSSSTSATTSTSTSRSSASTAGTAAASTVAPGTSTAGASTQAFCQQYTTFIKSITANVATPSGFAQFKQDYAAIAANAPAAIQSDLASLNAQAQAMQSAEDATSVTVGTAQTNVDSWVKDNCPNFAADVGVGAPTSSTTR
ncbi:MAG: hypothetical protein U0Q07_12590 [Acidimicrobiales bacterium]